MIYLYRSYTVSAGRSEKKQHLELSLAYSLSNWESFISDTFHSWDQLSTMGLNISIRIVTNSNSPPVSVPEEHMFVLKCLLFEAEHCAAHKYFLSKDQVCCTWIIYVKELINAGVAAKQYPRQPIPKMYNDWVVWPGKMYPKISGYILPVHMKNCKFVNYFITEYIKIQSINKNCH